MSKKETRLRRLLTLARAQECAALGMHDEARALFALYSINYFPTVRS